MRRRKKLFRPKRRYKIKRRNDNVLKIAAGVAAVAALVFVGYSVAGPISSFIREHGTVQSENETWAPDTDVPFSISESLPETTTVASETLPEETTVVVSQIVTTLPVTESKPVETTVTETQTEIMTEPVDLKSDGVAKMISADIMNDMSSLGAALDELAESGCSAVIFPVKTEGGIFRYATKIELVHTVYEGTDPIASEITAEELVRAANSRGLRAVGLVSVLTDNNRYGDYRDGSYRTKDDDAWLDASPDKGGKPWLSPFDDVTKEYMCDIVKELAAAGFDEIIADDFTFPEFRSSDVELIGDYIEPYGDRYLALTELAKLMTEAGEKHGAKVMLRVTANSIVKGYSELFAPEELDGCTVIVDYSECFISKTMVYKGEEIDLGGMNIYDKVSTIFGSINSRNDEMNTAVMIERESMVTKEFDDAVRAVTALGYDKYYIY